ncbi:MAG: tryptophan halogenase family protein [Pseudoxanthomonas sp.]
MEGSISHVVIVGGGSAGWLTAGLIASEHRDRNGPTLRVTLLESPDVPAIGVGEGTWPTMRDTLRRIGVSESDFVRACDATFKQGSRFVGWRDGGADDVYYHPFVLPQGYGETNLVAGWLARDARIPFAHLTSFQPHLCDAGRGPKQFATPEFAAVANYAYHLDATSLGVFLREHCVQRLGVHHVVGHMEGVDSREDGDIAAIRVRGQAPLAGDLFVDCTGMRSLLLGGHYGVQTTPVSTVLFNDRALALQVPYVQPDAPIASHTSSTAQEAGWIWDIGLSARRGTGYVYSSAHTSDEAAEAALRTYIEKTGGPAADSLPPARRIDLSPGYRRTAWHRNCVAVGLASGFVEPLEASSLVLVELAATRLAEEMPATRADMEILSARFNDTFAYRWQRVVEFLKLHYVLSRRQGDYWRQHRDPETVPESLQAMLQLWTHQSPSRSDLPRSEEIFPSASWQYILYGMGALPQPRPARRGDDPAAAEGWFREAATLAQRMLPALPSHRALVEHIKAHGLPRI